MLDVGAAVDLPVESFDYVVRAYPPAVLDGWDCGVENVSALVMIGVDGTGHREVIDVAEDMKENKASWEQSIRSLIERGLRGVGLVATVNAMLPDARCQRCMVHFMRNVLSNVSHRHAAWAAGALKAAFAMESRQSALEKAESVARGMESNCLREGIGESTTYLPDDYPAEHRRRIRTNNMIGRLNRHTRVVGSFPDGRSALILICARIWHVNVNDWSIRRAWTCPGSTASCRQPTEVIPRRRAEPRLHKTSGTT